MHSIDDIMPPSKVIQNETYKLRADVRYALSAYIQSQTLEMTRNYLYNPNSLLRENQTNTFRWLFLYMPD